MRNRPTKNSSAYAAPPPARHKGLTLIELLVAIGVLAFIAVLGWRGLDSIVRSRIALTEDLERTRGMQLAFAQMQSDCAHLASASVLQKRMPLHVEQGRFSLVRTVLADNQPSRLQVVTYSLKDGILARRESVVTRDLTELDVMWQAAVNGLETGPAVVLQSGVAELAVRLWINGGWRQDAGALPVVPAGANMKNLLPSGLEITSQMHGQRGGLLKIFLLGAV